MKSLLRGTLLLAIAFSVPSFAKFLPENNLKIMVGDKDAGGLTEKQFNDVIDLVEGIYAPIVSAAGGKLNVDRAWTDGTVNAYADRTGSSWQVFMFGGLARHKTITPDGFALVVCHELGHHLAGAPQYSGDWASNEGQSDYFATTKCLRRVWLNDDNAAIVAGLDVPPTLTEACKKNWSTVEDRNLCVRGGMAGDSVAKLFAAISWGRVAKFDTPDTNVVSGTRDGHPATQCRLDTYFQGALCEKSFSEDFGATDEVQGACHKISGHDVGLRPNCWFKASR